MARSAILPIMILLTVIFTHPSVISSSGLQEYKHHYWDVSKASFDTSVETEVDEVTDVVNAYWDVIGYVVGRLQRGEIHIFVGRIAEECDYYEGFYTRVAYAAPFFRLMQDINITEERISAILDYLSLTMGETEYSDEEAASYLEFSIPRGSVFAAYGYEYYEGDVVPLTKEISHVQIPSIDMLNRYSMINSILSIPQTIVKAVEGEPIIYMSPTIPIPLDYFSPGIPIGDPQVIRETGTIWKSYGYGYSYEEREGEGIFRYSQSIQDFSIDFEARYDLDTGVMTYFSLDLHLSCSGYCGEIMSEEYGIVAVTELSMDVAFELTHESSDDIEAWTEYGEPIPFKVVSVDMSPDLEKLLFNASPYYVEFPVAEPLLTLNGCLTGDGYYGPHYYVAWREYEVELSSGEYEITLILYNKTFDIDIYVYEPGKSPSQDATGIDYYVHLDDNGTIDIPYDGKWVICVDLMDNIKSMIYYNLTIDSVYGVGSASFTNQSIKGDGRPGPHYYVPWREYVVELEGGHYWIEFTTNTSTDIDVYVYEYGKQPSLDYTGEDYNFVLYENGSIAINESGYWVICVDVWDPTEEAVLFNITIGKLEYGEIPFTDFLEHLRVIYTLIDNPTGLDAIYSVDAMYFDPIAGENVSVMSGQRGYSLLIPGSPKIFSLSDIVYGQMQLSAHLLTKVYPKFVKYFLHIMEKQGYSVPSIDVSGNYAILKSKQGHVAMLANISFNITYRNPESGMLPFTIAGSGGIWYVYNNKSYLVEAGFEMNVKLKYDNDNDGDLSDERLSTFALRIIANKVVARKVARKNKVTGWVIEWDKLDSDPPAFNSDEWEDITPYKTISLAGELSLESMMIPLLVLAILFVTAIVIVVRKRRKEEYF